MNNVQDIRNEFKDLYKNAYGIGDTINIRNACFLVTEPTIFGTRNKKYIEAEIDWYESLSLNVNDLFNFYGKEVQIWKDISSKGGFINSNYGYCIYSRERGYQYDNALAKLKTDRNSRQASMIYQSTNMHNQWNYGGMSDFTCTNAVNYYITEDNTVDAVVQMRSNDAIFGFTNDLAWQEHVLNKLSWDLGLEMGKIYWSAASLHVYERHYKYLED